jgi:hypothetical protein
VQEEGSLPLKRSGEGGAKRRSAQAKRGRLGCLLRAPEAEPLRRFVNRIRALTRTYFRGVAGCPRWIGESEDEAGCFSPAVGCSWGKGIALTPPTYLG